MWQTHFRAGFVYAPLAMVMGSAGGTNAAPPIGDLAFHPVHIPGNLELGITSIGCYNGDTITDTDLSIRFGIYELDDDLLMSTLIKDAGLLSKNNSAVTVYRKAGAGDFTEIVLGPNKNYAFVSLLENDRAAAGTTQGFKSASPAIKAIGAIGDDSAGDFEMSQSTSGGAVVSVGHISGVATGGLPADLSSAGYETCYTSEQMPIPFFYVSSVTQV